MLKGLTWIKGDFPLNVVKSVELTQLQQHRFLCVYFFSQFIYKNLIYSYKVEVF